jgi:hypothetical protein
MAGGAPDAVVSGAKVSFPPWGLSQASPRAQRLGVQAGRAVRLSHQARAQRDRACSRRRRGGKRRGERDKVTDWWSQAVGERRRKEKGSVVVGLLGRTTGSARKALVGWLTDLGRKPARVRC